MDTNIGIIKENRSAVALQLGKLLADEFILYTKTRKAHWNIEGHDFEAMHLFFEKQYLQLEEIVDSVAERIRKIGHYAPATLGQLLQLTHLTETADHQNDGPGYLKELLGDHESIIEFLRTDLEHFSSISKDYGTTDFVTGVMVLHEEMAWKIRAHFR